MIWTVQMPRVCLEVEKEKNKRNSAVVSHQGRMRGAKEKYK